MESGHEVPGFPNCCANWRRGLRRCWSAGCPDHSPNRGSCGRVVNVLILDPAAQESLPRQTSGSSGVPHDPATAVKREVWKGAMNKRRRVKHYDQQLDAHLLTFSCFHRLPLLSNERTCQWFIRAIQRSREKYPFDLWAWVAMPDHAHVLIWPREEGYSTAVILKSIKTSVGKRAIGFLRKHHPQYLPRLQLRSGDRVEYHFWQDGPGHDRNLNEAFLSVFT